MLFVKMTLFRPSQDLLPFCALTVNPMQVSAQNSVRVILTRTQPVGRLQNRKFRLYHLLISHYRNSKLFRKYRFGASGSVPVEKNEFLQNCSRSSVFDYKLQSQLDNACYLGGFRLFVAGLATDCTMQDLKDIFR